MASRPGLDLGAGGLRRVRSRHQCFVADGPLSCSLDWRRSEGEEWTIAVETSDGLKLRLERGGAELSVNGEPQSCQGMGEYPAIYTHFVDLIDNRRSELDFAPLRLVADCLLVGRRQQAAAVTRA